MGVGGQRHRQTASLPTEFIKIPEPEVHPTTCHEGTEDE